MNMKKFGLALITLGAATACAGVGMLVWDPETAMVTELVGGVAVLMGLDLQD